MIGWSSLWCLMNFKIYFMENIYISLLIVLILIVLTWFNFRYLRFFKNKAKVGKEIEEKENYFKLDAKIELHKFMAIAVISVAGFFGYYQFADFSKEFNKMEQTVKKFEELSEDYDSLKNLTDELKVELKQFDTLDFRFNDVNTKINRIENNIQQDKIQELLKQLVMINFRFLGIEPLLGTVPTNAQIIVQTEESKKMLKNVGFSDVEIEKIIVEAKKGNKYIK